MRIYENRLVQFFAGTVATNSDVIAINDVEKSFSSAVLKTQETKYGD